MMLYAASAIMAGEVATAEEAQLTTTQRDVIEVFVQGAMILGLPKSLGEIYGLLYISEEPLTMEQVRTQLGLSLGSASQGLKQLRAFKAVKTVYRPGERTNYFTAEAEFRKLAAGFLREEVFPHLEAASERLDAISENAQSVQNADGSVSSFQIDRISKLKHWHKLSRDIFGKLTSLINF